MYYSCHYSTQCVEAQQDFVTNAEKRLPPALMVGYAKTLVLEQVGLTLYLFIFRINQNTLLGFYRILGTLRAQRHTSR